MAPNAYAAYRGYDVAEPVLRIQTAQALEGICRLPDRLDPRALRPLIGIDPFKLFQFGERDRITGPAHQHERFLAELRGVDVALIDLIGRALNRPAADVLGSAVRQSVQAYDSSVYMEDMLAPKQRQNLVYLKGGAIPSDPVELVVKKAEWVVTERAEGFKAMKIKIGRRKWMRSLGEATERDVAVTSAVRKAIGPDIRLLVDGNRGYSERPLMAFDYATSTASSNIYFMEEMFPEDDIANMLELKKRLRAAGNPVKLAAGESHAGGLTEPVYTQRVQSGAGKSEPLMDVEQADMNTHGFLYLRAKAGEEAKLGMTIAPHNFGSKLGFYAQVHLGTVMPNFELAEDDDSQFPAFVAEGIEVRDGYARVTGAPGLGVALREAHLSAPRAELRL